MLDYIEKYPFMLTNACNDVDSRKKYNYQWKTLSRTLNSFGLGEKSVEQWQRALSDWVSKTKKKMVSLKNEKSKSGGGQASNKSLNELETRLMVLKGWISLVEEETMQEVGDDNV